MHVYDDEIDGLTISGQGRHITLILRREVPPMRAGIEIDTLTPITFRDLSVLGFGDELFGRLKALWKIAYWIFANELPLSRNAVRITGHMIERPMGALSRGASKMKHYLNEQDVHEAIRGTQGNPSFFNHSIAAFLNQRIASRQADQRRRLGYALEAIGLSGVVAAGIAALTVDPVWAFIVALFFIGGLIGYALSNPQ